MPPYAIGGAPPQPTSVEELLWKAPYGPLMVYDPAQDDSYDALVIRDMQTTYGAYWKMQEPVGATQLVSRGPLFPTVTPGGGSQNFPNTGMGPIPRSVDEGFTNRAWRFKNGFGLLGMQLNALADRPLFWWSGQQSFTIETWIYLEGVQNRGAGNGAFFFLHQPSGGWRVQVGPTNHALVLQRTALGSQETVASPNNGGLVAEWKWCHVVYTYDVANLRVYANGVLVGTQAAVANNPVADNITNTSGSSPLVIGGYMDGYMARAALYGNVVLTPAQVLEHAQAGSPGLQMGQEPVPIKWAVPGLVVAVPFVWAPEQAAPTTNAVSDSDTGSGDDSISALAQAYAVSDTGAGADASALTALLTGTDTGVGAEAATETYPAAGSDTGSGSESGVFVVSAAGSDAGTGAEVSALLALLTGTDVGAGADASVLLALLTGSDTGAGSESGVAQLYIVGSDSGTDSEIGVFVPVLFGTDTGTGAESALLSALYTGSDAGVGVEAMLALSLQAFDSGLGTETFALRSLFTGSDAGAGSDLGGLLLALVGSDTGVGSELSAVLRLLLGSDVGLGTDTLTQRRLTATDAAAAVDAGSYVELIVTGTYPGPDTYPAHSGIFVIGATPGGLTLPPAGGTTPVLAVPPTRPLVVTPE